VFAENIKEDLFSIDVNHTIFLYKHFVKQNSR
jgi:hypothetical protein